MSNILWVGVAGVVGVLAILAYRHFNSCTGCPQRDPIEFQNTLRCLVKFGGVLALILVLAWLMLPLKQVPVELPIATSTPEAEAATRHFWEVFHGNDYARLPAAIEQMERANTGDDPVLLGVLCAAHLWKFQERTRLNPQIKARDAQADLSRALSCTEQHTQLLGADAQTTFARAIRVAGGWQQNVLNGWQPNELSSVEVEALVNTQIFPQFHGFVQGWVLASMLSADSPRIEQAVLGFQLLADSCAGFHTPPNQKFNWFIYSYFSLKSLLEPDCYNNPVAPHSVEATFLATGDLMVKLGRFDAAQIWYDNARLSPTFGTWIYRDIAERRARMSRSEAEVLSREFRAASGRLDLDDPANAMSFQSSWACTSCHAR